MSMSHINYDFLTESFLFKDKSIEERFKSYTDKQLRDELDRYRDYVLSNMEMIRKEITLDKRKINVTIESFVHRPSKEFLKQLVLYIDCVLIADPLFDLTEIISNASEVMAEYIGMQRLDKIDRENLIDSLKYMKENTPLIECDFIKFVPISLIHEVPKDIPIRFDEHGFRDALPESLMSMLKEKMDVRNMVSDNGRLIVLLDKPLQKGTMLYLRFPEIDSRPGEVVTFQRMELDGGVALDGGFKAKLYIPDDISDYEFTTWLEQSRNTAAKQLVDEISKEYAFAAGFNSMYLTESQLKASILASMWDGSSRADIANLAMNLRLPIIDNADLITILDIREKYGESFKNFRVSLGNELIKLREIDDLDRLKKQLEELSYQINEVNVNDIDQDMRKLKNSIIVDGVIVTGSLLMSCMANDSGSIAGNAMSVAGIISGLFVTAKELSADLKGFADIEDRPEFFLWKLEKKIWKMK